MDIFVEGTPPLCDVIVVKALTWHVRDVDLNPTWFQFISVKTGIQEKDAFMHSHYNMMRTYGRTYDIKQRVFPQQKHPLCVDTTYLAHACQEH